MVGAMGQMVNGKWEWNMGWRRTLRGREQTWESALLNVLQNISITEGERDRWCWKGAANGYYSHTRSSQRAATVRQAEGDLISILTRFGSPSHRLRLK